MNTIQVLLGQAEACGVAGVASKILGSSTSPPREPGFGIIKENMKTHKLQFFRAHLFDSWPCLGSFLNVFNEFLGFCFWGGCFQ